MELTVHGLDQLPGLEPASDVRLVRGNHQQQPFGLEPTTGLGGIGIELERGQVGRRIGLPPAARRNG
jgi:hypothetical protein